MIFKKHLFLYISIFIIFSYNNLFANTPNFNDKSNKYQSFINNLVQLAGYSLEINIMPDNSDSVKGSGAIATCSNQNMVLYYPPFLENVYNNGFGFGETSINNTNSRNLNWQQSGVLAHELGHIILNHCDKYLINGKRKQAEIEADIFMGRILHLLGATLAQAQSCLYLPIVKEEETGKYPSRNGRLNNIKKGWDSYIPENDKNVEKKLVKARKLFIKGDENSINKARSIFLEYENQLNTKDLFILASLLDFYPEKAILIYTKLLNFKDYFKKYYGVNILCLIANSYNDLGNLQQASLWYNKANNYKIGCDRTSGTFHTRSLTWKEKNNYIFLKNGKFGIKDKKENILVNNRYNNIYHTSQKSFFIVDSNNKYGLINTSDAITPFIYDKMESGYFYETLYSHQAYKYLYIYKNDKMGIVNYKGIPVIPCIYNKILMTGSDNYFSVKNNNKWGLIDNNNKQIIPYIFDSNIQIIYKNSNLAFKHLDEFIKVDIDQIKYLLEYKILKREIYFLLERLTEEKLIISAYTLKSIKKYKNKSYSFENKFTNYKPKTPSHKLIDLMYELKSSLSNILLSESSKVNIHKKVKYIQNFDVKKFKNIHL